MIHSILGGISGILTIASGILILQISGWGFYFDHLHNILGIVFLFLCIILVLGGIFALTLMKVTNMDWNTRSLLRLKSVHKYFGYFISITVQATVLSGIYRRISIAAAPHYSVAVGWMVALGVVFFLSLIILEIRHQIFEASDVQISPKNEIGSMSRAEFDRGIKSGNKYMILDDLVLDVSEFINQHPGGKFVIRHNVGTDISKFFFGGYCLEDNDKAGIQGHRHSNQARLIVNDLAIAKFENDIQPACVEVKHSIHKSKDIASGVRCVNLVAESVKLNFRNFYEDHRVIGKHFRVELSSDANLSRHYTICNVMQPEIYDAYLNALNENERIPERVLNPDPQDYRTFVIKNYNKGMS